MELLRRLFGGRRRAEEAESQAQAQAQQAAFEAEWEPVAAYVDADPEEALEVSVIASALAAANYPDSQFVVKRVLKRNPEATTVSVIASAIAAGDAPDSQWAVKHIYQKRT